MKGLFVGVDVTAIKDPGVRRALESLQQDLHKAFGTIGSLLRTELLAGLASVHGSITPRALAGDPTTTTTFGYENEICVYNGDLFVKLPPTGTDRQWRAV